jgi:hypothetical protein
MWGLAALDFAVRFRTQIVKDVVGCVQAYEHCKDV